MPAASAHASEGAEVASHRAGLRGLPRRRYDAGIDRATRTRFVIKVTVLYPQRAGARFDMDYYCDSHMPLVQSKLRPALKGIEVDKGLAGEQPGSAPAYVAMGHLWFDSVAAFDAAFGANADAILADIPNYTDIQPIVQISEVMID
jgi:uncharacterized protein (TIGR02118 family)